MNIDELTKDLQQISDAYALAYDIDRSSDWHMMKLTEELGELMQGYLKLKGQARTGDATEAEMRTNFEDELADVLGMTLLLAQKEQVDIKAAITRKWLKHLKKE